MKNLFFVINDKQLSAGFSCALNKFPGDIKLFLFHIAPIRFGNITSNLHFSSKPKLLAKSLARHFSN